MQWEDALKTKSVQNISMSSTIHIFQIVDSSRTARATAVVIHKSDVIIDYNVTMGGVDLFSRVLTYIILSDKKQIDTGSLLSYTQIYLSILLKKIVLDKTNTIRLKYREIMVLSWLIEEIMCFGIGPNSDTNQKNLIRLTGRYL